MVNTNEITRVYNDLYSAMLAKYTVLWEANQIDAETFANLVGQASNRLIELSVSTVQQQLQIDKDLEVKDSQIALTESQKLNVDAERLNIPKQGLVLDLQAEDITKGIEYKDAQIIGINKDNEVKTEQVLMSIFERTEMQPKQLEKISKEIDVTERSMVEQELTGTKDRAIKDYQLDTLLPLDKEKAEKDILLSLAQTGKTKIEADVTHVLGTKDSNIKDATLTAMADDLTTKAKERELLDKDIKLKQQQDRVLYVERIIKDKEAANLGLDAVVKNINNSPEVVYQPKYFSNQG